MYWGRLLIYFLAAAGAHGAAEKPAFEVVSVRPAMPNDQYSYRFGPGNGFVATNARLIDLLLLGWHLQGFQLGEVPAWAESARFNVEGRAEGAPGDEDFREMIQSMLRDRFRLVAHMEAEARAIYTLETGRTGIKSAGLEITRENECIERQGTRFDPPRKGGLPVCGVGEKLVTQDDGTVLLQMYGKAVTMEMMARLLGTELGRHVENATRVEGAFDFSLGFTPDPARALSFNGTRFDVTGPSLFTALQEKLGLQLRAGRGEVEMLVVERAERPSQN